MPKFYIDVRHHFGISEDLDGMDLPDFAAAHAEALRIAGKLVEEWGEALPRYGTEIAIQIVGEDLRPLMTIPYPEIAAQARRS